MYPEDQYDNWSGWEQPKPAPQPEKKRVGWSSGKVVALTLCCSLIAGLLGAGGAIAYQSMQAQKLPSAQEDVSYLLEGKREHAIIQMHEVDTGTLMTAAEVYAANVNSTVGITTSVTTNFWGYQTTSAASGSGFIISQDGYILTNYHVIEGSSAITVACYDGTSYEAALIGYDKSNDIAVLKVEANDLVPVVLGSSDKMNVGDSVLAIGNPLGELTFSLTSGSVSALDRQITMSTGATMTLIQTDCAINSGNSGGALFNLYGEVVGITNAKYSSSSSGASIDNIGFAIPIDDVRMIVESIIQKGYISKPYIGVSVMDVSAETQRYGLPQGAAVQSISESSPAAEAGLQVSDIITHINGTAISGSSELVSTVGNAKAGDVLVLTVYRKGSTLEVRITVGEQIQDALQQEQNQSQQFPQQYYWGR